MSSHRLWTTAGLQLAYFTGAARVAELSGSSAGVILRFERIRPRRRGRFQPLRGHEITPHFLDRMLRSLKRWNCEVISLAEVCDRIRQGRVAQRFVCLTFDGGSRDVMTFAYPVLARHKVPFALYLPTAFPDGLGEAWWLALEQVIATTSRVALEIDHNERRFDTESVGDKYRVFHFLASWMRALGPSELSAAIQDLCKRYSVDLAHVTREAVMNWEDIARLSDDPNVTIGSATVHYPPLANLSDTVALREVTMGRAVLESAIGRDAEHFAFPFGDCDSFSAGHVTMLEQAGFASALTSVPGVIGRRNMPALHALPRIAWDGRNSSLRGLRVLLAGLMPGAADRIGRTR